MASPRAGVGHRHDRVRGNVGFRGHAAGRTGRFRHRARRSLFALYADDGGLRVRRRLHGKAGGPKRHRDAAFDRRGLPRRWLSAWRGIDWLHSLCGDASSGRLRDVGEFCADHERHLPLVREAARDRGGAGVKRQLSRRRFLASAAAAFDFAMGLAADLSGGRLRVSGDAAATGLHVGRPCASAPCDAPCHGAALRID